jgi:hypothetical protein
LNQLGLGLRRGPYCFVHAIERDAALGGVKLGIAGYAVGKAAPIERGVESFRRSAAGLVN